MISLNRRSGWNIILPMDAKLEKDERLKLYIIGSHVDKPLTVAPPRSVYDNPIQAGAALTDKRVYELNDHDDFPESISDRNPRYSEVTAMWWVRKHIYSPYIGIAHYRRRLAVSDDQIAAAMDEGVDLITSTQMIMEWSIEENYRRNLWSSDWDLFMDILGEYAPQDLSFAEECFRSHQIHLCNMNIMKAELYKEFCDWTFPMLDAFYRKSPEKTDIYLHRDVGFIAERLSHLFVMKMKASGKKVIEAEIVDLQSSDWDPESECDTGDFDAVWNACDRLYQARQITRCHRVLSAAIHKGGENDDRLKALLDVMVTGTLERAELPQTMHEYLPKELRFDLATLLATYDGFKKVLLLWDSRGDEASGKLLSDYMALTHFSKVAARRILQENRQEG